MVDGLPAEVQSWATHLAARVGIDAPSALSHCAEAWAMHPQAWHTVAHHHCVDQRRAESGRLGRRAGGDHRPLTVLDEPVTHGATITLGDTIPDPGDPLGEVETRCDLVALVSGLDDADLGRLARWYWLGVGPGDNTPAAVALARSMRHARAQAVAKAVHRPPPQGCPLTAREREVLGSAADGLTMQAIGARLFISPQTVKTHLGRIARRLNADNTTHAVALALRAGWIT